MPQTLGGSAGEVLTHEEAVRRARALAPRIRERALRCEHERRVPRETIDEFVAAGLGKVLTPKRWGGYEISHDAACDVILEIGAACASTAWCCSFLLTHVWWFTAFPVEAQADVYRDGPDVNLAGAFAGGTATAVDGGYRITGRNVFASGVDHCDWALLGAQTAGGTEPPHARMFLVPRTDYRIDDTWHSIGMRGTGSNDIITNDVFVPAYRSVRFDDILNCTGPGREVIDGPIYRLPLKSRNHDILAPALGAARGALDEWCRWARGRGSNFDGASFTADVHRQLTSADVESEIDAVELVMRRNLTLIRNGGPIDEATCRLIAASGAHAAQRLCAAMELLMKMAGASGQFDQNPIQRAWRDVHAVSMHFALNANLAGVARGRTLLGLDV